MSKYHFIGIKGSGMSSLAQIAYDMGHEVQGSDEETYFFTQEKLEQRNIPMYGYNAENIKEGFEVILGNAFDETHIEYRAAKDLGLKIYTYAQFLGKLLDEIPSIAVTGAHGKTTTSTMVSNIFKHNFVTSYLIGDGTGHGEKNSDYIVAEACEYYRHFLAYHPNYAIVTNIDFDHPDYFNDEHDMFDAFQSFVNQVKDTVVICGDDRLASQLKPSTAKVVTYGFNEGNDYQIKNVKTTSENSEFDVYKNSELLGTFTMAVFGLHDISNATSAIALADICGLSTDEIQQSLGSYHHAERRFTEHKVGTNIVVDDYAHHPDEIRATLASAAHYPHNHVWVVFQPHTYSRTKLLFNEFADALSHADKVVLAKIYAARETDTLGISSADLCEKIQSLGKECIYIDNFEDIEKYLLKNCINGDLLITMGAGDVYKIGEDLLK